MGRKFASGKYALGICDVCGQQFPLTTLKPLTIKGHRTGIMACPADWNADHPQNKLGEVRVDDPQALRNPRPDIDPGREPMPDWQEALSKIMRNLP
jgi:hypothetical protein